MRGHRKPLPPVEAGIALTISEVAALLRLPETAARKLVLRGDLPSRLVGREYRVHRDVVDRWLREGDPR